MQGCSRFVIGVVGPTAFLLEREGVTKRKGNRMTWKTSSTEGDRPVDETEAPPVGIPSSASPVKPGVNPRGPPRKAKYYLVTDSAK